MHHIEILFDYFGSYFKLKEFIRKYPSKFEVSYDKLPAIYISTESTSYEYSYNELLKTIREYELSNSIFKENDKVVIKKNKYICFSEDRNIVQNKVFTIKDPSYSTMRSGQIAGLVELVYNGKSYGYVTSLSLEAATPEQIEKGES